MIEDVLYKLLTQDPYVTTTVADRIYPIWLEPNATFPAISYTVTFCEVNHSLAGSSKFERALVDVDLWANTHEEIKDLHKLVRSTLDAFRGSIAGVDVQSCLVKTWMDVPEDQPSDPPIYHRTLEVEIQYTYTGP